MNTCSRLCTGLAYLKMCALLDVCLRLLLIVGVVSGARLEGTLLRFQAEEAASQGEKWAMHAQHIQQLPWRYSPAFGKGEYGGVIKGNPKWLPPGRASKAETNPSSSSTSDMPPAPSTPDQRSFYQMDYWDWVTKQAVTRKRLSH